MEKITEKIMEINLNLDVLEDDDQSKFSTQEFDKIVQINSLIDELQSKLLLFNVSKKKCQEIIIQNKKENTLAKKLYPYYWFLNESLNELSVSLDNNKDLPYS